MDERVEGCLTPAVEGDLRAYSCAVIPSFRDGLDWINGQFEEDR